MKNLINKIKQNPILILILLWGITLRLYNFFSIPFTHDEFSALFRTGYSSFSELIEKGVLVDFHPAGIQVFLNYYSQLFGSEEWILKLPFALLGILSIYACYVLGKEWFNKKTGLLIAAFVSSTQFFVFYSQIARPYIAGLFFGLWSLIYLKRFLFDGETVNPKALIGWILCATLCAYIHYYLLVSLVLLALIFLLFSPRNRKPLFILSGLGIFILYLPHLSIFIRQLSKGGIESWLGKPKPDFLIQFTEYLFEYSSLFILATSLLFVLSLLLSFNKLELTKIWWIAVFGFFASFMFGYLYSIKVNAILQFSGLLFTAPLILSALFYFLSKNKLSFYLGLLCFIGLGSYELIAHRSHYSILYESPYDQIVKQTTEELKVSSDKTLVILDTRSDILNYYLKKHDIKHEVVLTNDEWNAHKMDSLFRNSTAKRLIVGHFVNSPYATLQIAQHYFPNIKRNIPYYHGEFYLLEKEDAKASPFWNSTLSFNEIDNDNPYWGTIDSNSLKEDSLGNTYYPFQSIYGLKMELNQVEKFENYPNSFLDMKTELQWNNTPSEVYIATAAYKNDSLINWQTTKVSKFQNESKEKHWVFHSFPLNGLPKNTTGIELRLFFYNPQQTAFRVYRMQASFRPGNPKLYGLYYPMGTND